MFDGSHRRWARATGGRSDCIVQRVRTNHVGNLGGTVCLISCSSGIGSPRRTIVLAPELQTMLDSARAQFRTWLAEDENRSCVGDLLAAEELAGEVGRVLSVGLMEDFVQFRDEQALAGRVACACGCPKSILRYSTWPRKTPFGVVMVRDVYI